MAFVSGFRGLPKNRHGFLHISPWILSLVVGCAGDPSGAKGRVAAGDPMDAAAQEAVAVRPVAAKPQLGAPHSGNLIEVALDQEGSAAVTLDELGGARFWAALDGSREPTLVRASLANVDLFRVKDDWRLAGIDPSGSVHLLRFDALGNGKELLSTPPSPKAIDVLVIDETTIAVLGEDHAVRWMRGGATEATYVDRGFRPTEMWRLGDGTVALAAVRGGEQTSTIELRRVRQSTAGASVVASREIEIGNGSELPRTLRMSPDGARIAAFERNTSTGKWTLWVADTASEKKRRLELNLHISRAPGGAFDGNDAFVASDSFGFLRVAIGAELEAGANLSGPAAHLLPTSADGRGSLIAAGAGSHLYLYDVRKRSELYLGYEAIAAMGAELSPSGQRVAWTSGSRIIVHDVDARTERIIQISDGAPYAVRFFGNERIVALFANNRVDMYDATTSARIDTSSVMGNWGEVRDDLLLVQPNSLVALSDKGFTPIGQLGPIAGKTKLIRQDGEWKVLAFANVDGGARILDVDTIRAGIGAKELLALPVVPGYRAEMVIDDLGRIYQQTGSTLTRKGPDGTTSMTLELQRARPFGSPVVDRAGERVVATSGAEGMALVFDGTTGQRIWSALGVSFALSWSDDHGRALMSGKQPLGLAVLDGKTGAPIRTICGFGFRAQAAPPTQRANNATGEQNLCSR